MGSISSSAVLSHLLSHRMMAHNGPSRFLRYPNRRWDAKLEENWFDWSEEMPVVSLATKFQTFSPKRSAAEQELLKNYIPPTHLRPPWSLFNFLEVALVGVWESGGLVTAPKEGGNDGGALHTRALAAPWRERERMMDSPALLRLPNRLV